MTIDTEYFEAAWEQYGDDDDLANIYRQEALDCGDDGPDLEQDALGMCVVGGTVQGPLPLPAYIPRPTLEPVADDNVPF